MQDLLTLVTFYKDINDKLENNINVNLEKKYEHRLEVVMYKREDYTSIYDIYRLMKANITN